MSNQRKLLAESLAKSSEERDLRRAKGQSTEADDILGIELRQEHVEINVNQIDTSPFQPRLVFDEEYIESLSESIADVGLNQPIVVRKRGERFELISGENRLRAFKHQKRESIPAIVRHIDDAAAAKAATVDNLQRQDISDYEIACALFKLRDNGFETSPLRMSRLIGRSKTLVIYYLSFEKLPAESRALLHKKPGILGATQMYKIKDFPTEGYADLVNEAIRLLYDGKIEQSSLEGWIRNKISPRTDKTVKTVIRTTSGQEFGALYRDGYNFKVRISNKKVGPDRLNEMEAALLKTLEQFSDLSTPTE